jgi:DNA-directed RNA polymerase specialized sigma subunit
MRSTNFAPSTYQDDVLAFNAVTSRHSKLYEGFSHEEVWMDYITSPSSKIREQSLEELLYRQNGMLSKIANYIWRAHSESAEYTDFLEFARIAAISAYDRFNSDKDIKLNTFIFRSVQTALISIADEISSIRCPSGKRAFRAYFKGTYDNNPEKKAKFEIKYAKHLANQKKMSKIKQQCETIEADIISYDDYVTTDDGQIVDREFSSVFTNPESDSIIEKVDWSNAVNKLSFLQQRIYTMFFVEGYTALEISENIGVADKEIKKQISLIKSYFKKKFPEFAKAA